MLAVGMPQVHRDLITEIGEPTPTAMADGTDILNGGESSLVRYVSQVDEAALQAWTDAIAARVGCAGPTYPHSTRL